MQQALKKKQFVLLKQDMSPFRLVMAAGQFVKINDERALKSIVLGNNRSSVAHETIWLKRPKKNKHNAVDYYVYLCIVVAKIQIDFLAASTAHLPVSLFDAQTLKVANVGRLMQTTDEEAPLERFYCERQYLDTWEEGRDNIKTDLMQIFRLP